MSFILAALSSRMAAPVALGLAVILALGLAAVSLESAIYRHRLNGDISDLRGRLALAEKALGTCHASLGTLEAGIGAQNAAVQAVAAESAGRTAAAEAALQQAQASARRASEAAASILARKPGDDRCASALAVIRGAGR